MTVTAMSCVAPSASATSARASSPQTCVSAAVKPAGSGTERLAPETSSVTVSDVDMQPSESTRSNVSDVAVRSAAAAVSASTTASVVITQSIVARPGASIPAPLAMPPMVHFPRSPSMCMCAVLGTVSVVMIATAASGPPSGESASTATSTPASSVSMGSRSPIRPVEQTTTSPAEISSAAPTFSAVACVSWKPSGPVQTLAPPELRTTALTTPSATA